jgi:mevalonate kinase
VKNEHFYAHGKLLLSGEYFVLDGAKALAIPTCFGQHLDVTQIAGEEGRLYWDALDEEGTAFLSVLFDTTDFKALEKRGEVPHFLLQDLLRAARAKNPQFVTQRKNLHAVTRLEFHPAWGLGSSSTLIYNVATWAKVDAVDLLFQVLDGSGYDVACAGAQDAIVYQLKNGKPVWQEFSFQPPFAAQLYFIYLGKKQNSSDAVKKFREAPHDKKVIERISDITESMIRATTASEFRALMEEHENVVAEVTHLQKVKELYFNDFPGAIKSLGAWGGDFVMALAQRETFDSKGYFKLKGFETVFSFEELLFNPEKHHPGNVKSF